MQRYPGFSSGSHASRSKLANGERTINFYPENVGDKLVLYPTPGYATWINTGVVGCRAAFSENGRNFVVMGNGFYEVNITTSTLTLRNPALLMVVDSFPAQIVSNGAGGQLLICSGGNAYCFVLATNAFSLVLTGEAFQIGMLDSYFLAFNRTLSKVRFSALNDGTSWNALDFFLRSIASDNWQAMTVSQGRIFLIGEKTGEVWWDQGGSSIPFAPIQSSTFSFGIVAPWTLHVVADTVRWLARTRDGQGVVVSARGYRPERISDHSTETAIANYALTARIDDAEALFYQEAGHTFSAFRFPSANATRVYDDATDMWHERGTWDLTQGQFIVWSPRIHVLMNGKHVVGDSTTSNLYFLDQQYTTDNGAIIRRERWAPVLHGDGERVFVDRLELYVEPGLGPQPGTYYDDPKVALQMSYDGGKTWGNERYGGAGLVGQYHRRLAFTRCGSGWSVQPRFVCTDPVTWNVIDCYVDASGFQPPQQRSGEAA